MGLQLIVPPVSYPVSLEEAKQQCRVLHDDEDALISSYIVAATVYVETRLNRTFLTRTYALTLDSFSDYIALPRGPVASVTSVTYIDDEGNTQIVDPAIYTVDTESERPWVVRNSAESWPGTMSRINAVKITYVAGEPTFPANWEDIRVAILLLIGHWFNVRETVNVGTSVTEVPFTVDALLANRREVRA